MSILAEIGGSCQWFHGRHAAPADYHCSNALKSLVSHAMSYRGYIENGKVRLVDGTDLADGTEVRVEPIRRHRSARPRRKSVTSKRSTGGTKGTLASHYADVIGALTDLPRDFSHQHDHYLYGHPKRR